MVRSTHPRRPRFLRGPTTDARQRLSRLGRPEELSGREPPRQRTANELIAAVRDLTDHQTRVLYARREGDFAAASAAAAQERLTEHRIDQLRRRLHEERRRELLGR
jgi:hypothetical protein